MRDPTYTVVQYEKNGLIDSELVPELKRVILL